MGEIMKGKKTYLTGACMLAVAAGIVGMKLVDPESADVNMSEAMQLAELVGTALGIIFLRLGVKKAELL